MTSLDTLVSDAAGLAWRLRDEDPATVHADLFALAAADPLRLVQTTCMLAAMVDVDRTVAELLAWTGDGPRLRTAFTVARQSRRRCRWCADGMPFGGGNTRYCSTPCRRESRLAQWREWKDRARAAVHSVDKPCGTAGRLPLAATG